MSWLLKLNPLVVLACMAMVTTPCLAQTPTDTLKSIAKEVRAVQEQLRVNARDMKAVQEQLNKLSESKTGVIHFAVSLGVRFIYDKKEYFGEPSISPIDSTLQIDSRDRGAVILSGVVMATPFVNKGSWLSNLGFVANVNLAEISSETFTTINNKSIEGGLGISYRLQSNFALALTYDLVFSRRLRDYVLTRTGEKLFENGKVLTELNPENNNLFIDDNLSSLSLKFIYRFGK
ncbi:MAG: hypothetical protein ONB44_03325 [candidate division KSB1 bacterium]|nr:hypothetical protein [candidate division KSB1 bacterium]MDZ7301159.1 hypothetical protein [candidate division KSB1 bacterium]MDZ7310617.1 hypothetical protein [candidate division KSB1 bacterium]